MATLAPDLDRRLPRPLGRPVVGRWTIPRRVRFASLGVLMMILGVGTALAAGAIQHQLQPANPFGPYQVILPGQPLAVLEDFPCSTAYAAYPHSGGIGGETYCQFWPEDEVFGMITVHGSRGVIRSATFSIKTLHLGDVVQVLGEPNEIRIRKEYFSMTWGNHAYASGRIEGRFGYWSPMRYLLLLSPTEG